MDFFLSLLEQEIPGSEYRSPLISGLAVQGISEKYTWLGPENYTKKLSGIITFSRALVLLKAFHLAKNSESTRPGSESSSESPDEDQELGDIYRQVLRLCPKTIVLTQYSGKSRPFSWIWQTRNYGMAIARGTSQKGTGVWIDNELSYQDITLSLDSLRSVIHGLFETVQERLYSELLFTPQDQLPYIDQDRLRDQPNLQSLGFNFLKDESNKLSELLPHSDTWLWNRLFTEKALKKRFVNAVAERRGEARFNLDQIRELFATHREFKDELMVLTQLAWGGPARSPEIHSIRFENSLNGGLRNIYWLKQLLTFTTFYHKGFMQSGKPKVIHRFLPHKISILFIHYLWLYVPFEVRFIQFHVDNAQFTPYFWPLKGYATTIPKKEQERPEAENPIRKRARAYTDLSDSSHKSDSSEDDITEFTDEVDIPYLLTRYNTWRPSSFSRALAAAFQSRIGQNIPVSKWRHINIAIFRHLYVDNVSFTSAYQGEYLDPVSDDDNDIAIHAHQTGHTVHTDQLKYAGALDTLPNEEVRLRDLFLKITLWWHSVVLLFEVNDRQMARNGLNSIDITRDLQAKKFTQFGKTTVRTAFQRIYGPDIQPRDYQVQGLDLIWAQNTFTLIISPTASGKSAFITVPSIVTGDSGLTVVIIPLIALREDLFTTFRSQNLKCTEWTTESVNSPPETANLVLVTPESVSTVAFTSFILRQSRLGRLDRIVIDECHMLLTAHSEYRPKILELKGLIRFKTQLVYLTATLKPKDLDLWFVKAGIPRGKTEIIRLPTVRHEIGYHVLMVPTEKDIAEKLKSHIHSQLRRYPDFQFIIFGGTIKRCKRLSELLGYPQYHSESGTKVQKRDLLQRFREKRELVIISTATLGQGL